MNPVAKEGPVVNNRHGVLVLSEGSSAYEQLRDGVLAISPADIEGTAEALYQSVVMSAEERLRRSDALVGAIEREDSVHWLLTQMRDIAALK